MKIGFATMLCLAAVPAMAGDPLSASEAQVSPRVLSATAAELAGDYIGRERAILLASANLDALEADLVIVAGHPDERAGEVLAVVRGITYAGRMSGQAPHLDRAENGSLLVRSQQTAIGRSPWEETLTLVERDGHIVVAGFTHTSWDRISATTSSCDWNLLTGNWKAAHDIVEEDGEEVRTERKSGRNALRIRAVDWPAQSETLYPFCFPDA